MDHYRSPEGCRGESVRLRAGLKKKLSDFSQL
jgi:hypothetical protein